MRTIIGLFWFAVAPGVFALADSSASSRPAAHAPATSTDLAARILKVHNFYRARVGSKPLQWSAPLSVAAGTYGPALAAIGKLVHSAKDGRRGQSENLWIGTRGVYSVEAMVEYWADERRVMRAGIFPDVSTTRDWRDVSHYTQMIWPETTHVGCHLQQTRTHEILICRYSPKGNRDGRALGR